MADLTSDGVRSAFNGAGHLADINANQLSNGDGLEVWYTDAFGRNGQTQPFAGSIRQRLAKMDNNIGGDAGGPVIGNNRTTLDQGCRRPIS